jgi:hypothetical protein
MRHWWEPIGLLYPEAGVITAQQLQAGRRLFQEANARSGGVVEMHHEVQRDPRVETGGDDGDAE